MSSYRCIHSSTISCMQEHAQQHNLLHAGTYTAAGSPPCRSIRSSRISSMQGHTAAGSPCTLQKHAQQQHLLHAGAYTAVGSPACGSIHSRISSAQGSGAQTGSKCSVLSLNRTKHLGFCCGGRGVSQGSKGKAEYILEVNKYRKRFSQPECPKDCRAGGK